MKLGAETPLLSRWGARDRCAVHHKYRSWCLSAVLGEHEPPGGDGEGVAVPALPGTGWVHSLMVAGFAVHVWFAYPLVPPERSHGQQRRSARRGASVSDVAALWVYLYIAPGAAVRCLPAAARVLSAPAAVFHSIVLESIHQGWVRLAAGRVLGTLRVGARTALGGPSELQLDTERGRSQRGRIRIAIIVLHLLPLPPCCHNSNITQSGVSSATYSDPFPIGSTLGGHFP